MSGKPVHAGHWGLIELASSENDSVQLFVSLGDRVRPGEVVVKGSDMARIWREQLEPNLPKNVTVGYVTAPVQGVIKVIGDARQAASTDTFTIYADPHDLATIYTESLLSKYGGDLHTNGQIILRAVPRSETVDVSGTQMRAFISNGDKAAFIMNLPACVDGPVVWDILSNSHAAGLLKSFVSETVRSKAASKRRSR